MVRELHGPGVLIAMSNKSSLIINPLPGEQGSG